MNQSRRAHLRHNSRQVLGIRKEREHPIQREGNPVVEFQMAGHEGWLSNGTARPRYCKNNSRGAGRVLSVEAAIGLAALQAQPRPVSAVFR